MKPVSILGQKHEPITSVQAWFDFAPPKEGKEHWKDGRSAKELAKAWFRTGQALVPAEIDTVLCSNPVTAGFIPEKAWPEQVTKLDNFRGGPRNHDLVVLGQAGGKDILVCIEAKADEAFGPLIGECLDRAQPASNLPQRIDLLSWAIFGRPVDERIRGLRYQLLHALAGTLIEAGNRGVDQAVFIVHEFVSSSTKPKKRAENAADYSAFVGQMLGQVTEILENQLTDCLSLPGGQFVPRDISLLVGKVRHLCVC